jgi:hypothetical protein
MAKPTVEEMWRRMLTGDVPRLRTIRRVWGAFALAAALQALQRAVPGPGGVLMHAIGYGPSPLNRRLCKWCTRTV